MLKQINLLFLLLPFVGFGQDNTLDSLKFALKEAKHDSTRCRILSALVENEYNEKIWPLYNEQLFVLSKKNIEKSVSDREKKIFLVFFANANNNKGFLAQEHGDINLALECYFTSLKILDQTKNKKEKAVTINNIAYIYSHQGETNKALEFVNRALKIQKEINDSAGIAFSYNNLGNLYKNKKEIERCLNYFSLSLELQKKINNKEGISVALSNIGEIYVLQGNSQKGLDYVKQALKIREEMKDLDGVAYNLNSLANIMYDLGQYKEALNYSSRSFKIANEIRYIENIRNSSKILYKIYKNQNNSQKALKMFELYIKMHDSINNETIRKSSIKTQMLYEYQKKSFADSVKIAEEKKITTLQLKQEASQRYFLYGGLSVTALLGLFMVNRFRITNKQKKLITEQKKLVEQQKQVVEEKQKEILDSIRYAKRIQISLLPSEKYLDRIFNKKIDE
ncbi:MAG: tetratricopeptide repeat protein [Bacteroidota bacterium]|nr:tetratricopeptide repeat protein [Bacteroidota bacterium]MDP3144726.1 tetratricopeptide repeat protein [Bacteroidota bacterium]